MNSKLILSEEKLQAYWAWGHPKTSIILSLFTTLDQKKMFTATIVAIMLNFGFFVIFVCNSNSNCSHIINICLQFYTILNITT